MSYKIIELDSALKPYENDIKLRMDLYHKTRKELLEKNKDIVNFASGADYFGFHRTNDGWVYREWAPGAEKMYLMGDMNKWNPTSLPMTKKENGIFELYLKGKDYLYDGCKVKAVVIHNGELVYGPKDTYVSLVGIDKENHLICAGATANEALSWGIQEAVTFGPIFINNYNVVYKEGSDNLGMLNPRTAIGQRSDGTFMLLVVDGRGPTSFGALYEDIIKIFQDNDAVMAANLDGGNSSAMIYDGEYVNTPVSLYGSRNLPTVFLVKGGN